MNLGLFSSNRKVMAVLPGKAREEKKLQKGEKELNEVIDVSERGSRNFIFPSISHLKSGTGRRIRGGASGSGGRKGGFLRGVAAEVRNALGKGTSRDKRSGREREPLSVSLFTRRSSGRRSVRKHNHNTEQNAELTERSIIMSPDIKFKRKIDPQGVVSAVPVLDGKEVLEDEEVRESKERSE